MRETRHDWWRDAVIYQIYVRSFADADGDGVGDLPGATARLEHIADLGADAVWLTPFYPSPMADGGYDISDHRDVDPALGTLADADALLARAHDLGLRVIIDIVPNHTSDAHPWFREALASPPGSPARARYVFRDGRDGGRRPPSDWQSVFGGRAWQRTGDGQWYLHLFAPEQPDLNWANPQVAAEYHDVLRFWLDRGVDGFRFDVAHGMAKDLAEPLRDLGDGQVHHGVVGAGAKGTHPVWDRDEVHDILRSFRRVMDEHTPPRVAVAESWAEASRRALYTRADELHQAFNFDFLGAPWDATALRTVIDDSLAIAADSGAPPTWVLSNHDTVRHATRLALPAGTDIDAWLLGGGRRPAADRATGSRRARAAALLMLALPGSVYLYQGEELGLPEVADLPDEARQDPVFRRSGGHRKGRDGCRVPLPWTTTGPSLGFGAGPGRLPQPADWPQYSVQAQTGRPDGILELYRTALRLRREHGDDHGLTWREAPDPVLAFARGGLLAAVNTGAAPAAVEVPGGCRLLLASAEPPVLSAGTLTLAPDSAAWLRRLPHEG
ncbi:MAG TPA: glycoside hydrolase family 13 protein [Streptomyces sp.]|nr:glycoside hydrolase family 13 protein [Streptomyces sp.]